MSSHAARSGLVALFLTLAACGDADTSPLPTGGDAGVADVPVIEPADSGVSGQPDAEPEDSGVGEADATEPDAAVPDAAVPELSYTRDVWPIFERRCQGCHFVTDNPPQIIGADETHGRLVDQPSATVPRFDWIEPGDPDASYLLRKVEGTHRAVGGTGNTMPPRVADPTTAEERATLRAWISAGAPRN